MSGVEWVYLLIQHFAESHEHPRPALLKEHQTVDADIIESTAAWCVHVYSNEYK